jgi:signal transduction histidine kinase
MQNLLDNSAKYAKPQSSLCIEIGTREDNEQQTIFFVRDNGIGIDKQFHERIFGLFNQLDTSAEGTGIGLALVKRIIEVHGGHIWVESELGKGATFIFTLPKTHQKE